MSGKNAKVKWQLEKLGGNDGACKGATDLAGKGKETGSDSGKQEKKRGVLEYTQDVGGEIGGKGCVSGGVRPKRKKSSIERNAGALCWEAKWTKKEGDAQS